MKLTYVYHSCYVLEFENFSIIVDYYKDSGKSPLVGYVHDVLLSDKKRLYVLSSHHHPDHFNKDVLQWKNQKDDIVYLLSDDILDHEKAQPTDGVFIKKGDVFKDENIEVKAYGSTDAGISFLIKAGGKVLFHAGDLNNWHWMDESAPEEVREAELYYERELGDLAKDIKNIDLAMFPIDPRLGKQYMKGAQQLVESIEVAIMAPMHFSEAYDKVAAFSEYAKAFNCELLDVYQKGQSFEL